MYPVKFRGFERSVFVLSTEECGLGVGVGAQNGAVSFFSILEKVLQLLQPPGRVHTLAPAKIGGHASRARDEKCCSTVWNDKKVEQSVTTLTVADSGGIATPAPAWRNAATPHLS